jgi:GNAT superfamily N-acetyltransferase
MERTPEYKTTYVQMLSHSRKAVPPPKEGLVVMQAKHPTIGYYRFLYDAVGEPWNWRSRTKLTDDALAAIIHDPRDEVHVLFLDGVPTGFAELDRRVENEIEIVQFGLMPAFIGQRLGPYFLQWAIDQAWSYHPKRLWLHTCTADHPAALSTYLKAGFSIYKEEISDKP